MTDYGIVQLVQQFRILVESTVLPLAGLGIIAFAVVRVARLRAGRRSTGSADIEERLQRIERTLHSLSVRLPAAEQTNAIEERIANLESLVVDRELDQ